MTNEKTAKHCCMCHHEFENDETVWMNRDAERVCECCALEENGLRDGTPCCGYCGDVIDGNNLATSLRDDDGNIFCDVKCALRYYGYVKVKA